MAVAGVQGRGVLIDLHAVAGRARKVIRWDDLKAAMDAQGVVVETGDMVCLWTGFDQLILEQRGEPSADVLHRSCATLDGSDPRILQWITESGMAALISDNYAVEEYPGAAPPGDVSYPVLPLHHHCLFKLGVHLGELWYLAELAAWLRAHGRNRFLLTAPPLRLPGAVGSPATPIATV
jgi:kynurenine formamidase